MDAGGISGTLGNSPETDISYERGVNLPSTDILIKLAGIFDVTLDYLGL